MNDTTRRIGTTPPPATTDAWTPAFAAAVLAEQREEAFALVDAADAAAATPAARNYVVTARAFLDKGWFNEARYAAAASRLANDEQGR